MKIKLQNEDYQTALEFSKLLGKFNKTEMVYGETIYNIMCINGIEFLVQEDIYNLMVEFFGYEPKQEK